MITEILSTLKINKLTQEQYDKAYKDGNINANEIYLTPNNYNASDFANAIQNTANGEAIALNDVSPIEHNLKVKVTHEKPYQIAPYLYSDLSCETPITEWVDNGDSTGEDVPIESSGYFSVVDINKFITATKAKGVDFSSAQEFVIECDFNSDREYAIYNTVYYNGTSLATETYSEFANDWGIEFEYTNYTTSEAYTKITISPEVELSVSVGGKNFAQINNIITPISSEKPIIFSGNITGQFVLSCVLNCGYTYETASIFEVTLNGVAKHITPSAINLNPQGYSLNGTITQIKFVDYAHCQEGSIDDIQLEIGTIKTEYEPYKTPTTYSVNSDGTVEGIMSIYPSMSLVTNVEGASIDVTYNADTKKYIDNKFAELQALILES